MELNEQNLQQLATYLGQTLSPDPSVRRPGELLGGGGGGCHLVQRTSLLGVMGGGGGRLGKRQHGNIVVVCQQTILACGLSHVVKAR